MNDKNLQELHEILSELRKLSNRASGAGARVVSVELERAAEETEGLIAAHRLRRSASRDVCLDPQ